MRKSNPSPRHHAAIMLLLLAFTSIASAQPVWESLKGPTGGYVRKLATNAWGDLYAVVDEGWNNGYDQPAGIYYSSDNGVTWTPTKLHITNANLVCLVAPDSAMVLVGANSVNGPDHIIGVYCSTDHGMTWTFSDTLNLWNVSNLAATSSGTILAVTAQPNLIPPPSLLQSLDFGHSWHVVDTTPRACLVANSSGEFFSSKGDSVSRSTDGGLHWENFSVGFVGETIVQIVILQNNSLVVACRINHDTMSYYSSMDNGEHWQFRGRRENFFADEVFAAPNGDLITAGYGARTEQLLRSTDLGATWTTIRHDSSTISGAIALHDGEILVVPEYGHSLFKTPDDGASWLLANGNLAALGVSSMAVLGNGVYAGTRYDMQLLGPAGWKEIFPRGFSSVQVFDDTIFAVPLVFVTPDDTAGVWTTCGEGRDWVRHRWYLSSFEEFFAKSRTGTLFSGGMSGIMAGFLKRSTDYGNTWRQCQEGSRIPNSIVNGKHGRLFAGTSGFAAALPNGVIFSDDDGETWIAATLKGECSVRGVDSAGTVYAGVSSFTQTSYSPTFDSLWCSHDEGMTWSLVDTGFIGPMTVNALGHIFITGRSRVRRSTNNGLSWQEFSSGLPNDSIVAITTDSAGHLYCATLYNGVYRTTQSTTDVQSSGATIASHFFLAPNFPNPFSESTTLQYSLDQPANVELTIFDALGRERGRLIDERQSSGSHALNFWAGEYPAGVYTVRLTMNGKVVSRMMVIQR